MGVDRPWHIYLLKQDLKFKTTCATQISIISPNWSGQTCPAKKCFKQPPTIPLEILLLFSAPFLFCSGVSNIITTPTTTKNLWVLIAMQSSSDMFRHFSALPGSVQSRAKWFPPHLRCEATRRSYSVVKPVIGFRLCEGPTHKGFLYKYVHLGKWQTYSRTGGFNGDLSHGRKWPFTWKTNPMANNSGQMKLWIPKPELRGFWRDSLTFKVTTRRFGRYNLPRNKRILKGWWWFPVHLP